MQTPTFLEGVFRHYTEGAEEMDSTQYLKLAQDCHFVGQSLTKADIGNIFAKSVHPETKRLSFSGFKDNFNEFALKRGVSKNDIVRKIESYGKTTLFNSFSSLSSMPGSRSEISSLGELPADRKQSM